MGVSSEMRKKAHEQNTGLIFYGKKNKVTFVGVVWQLSNPSRKVAKPVKHIPFSFFKPRTSNDNPPSQCDIYLSLFFSTYMYHACYLSQTYLPHFLNTCSGLVSQRANFCLDLTVFCSCSMQKKKN